MRGNFERERRVERGRERERERESEIERKNERIVEMNRHKSHFSFYPEKKPPNLPMVVEMGEREGE